MYNVYRCNKHIYIIKVHPNIVIFILSVYTNVFNKKRFVLLMPTVSFLRSSFIKQTTLSPATIINNIIYGHSYPIPLLTLFNITIIKV